MPTKKRNLPGRWMLLARLALLLCLAGCQGLPLPASPQPTPDPASTPAPPPSWQDPDTYRQAMLASTADDVALIHAPTFYHIDAYVDVSGQPPRVYAIQDTHHTNRTEVPLDVLFFRLFPNKPSYGTTLTFEEITVEGRQVQVEYQADRTAAGIVLPSPLAPGQAVDVHMEYDVTVPVENIRGYGTFNYQDGMLLLSNFFPMVAVRENGAWNLALAPDYGDPVYAETSFFTVELTVRPELVVVTSGSTVAKRENDDGTVTWTCVSGPMRDFMVVMSERFVSSSLAIGFVRVNSYHLPEHGEWGEKVLNYARDSLRAYQQSFAPYPFAEFDVVEAPIYGGGMEYPGLIMLDQQHYEHGGEYLEFLTAHEVAHQWWYSVVGNDQVNVPWLDESLSNFSIVYYYQYAYDRERADLAFQSYVARRYDNLTPEGRDVPVQQPVDAFYPDEYGAIVYGKGAVFFYQLRQTLGDDTFLEVLRQYYQDRQYKLATGDDLLRAAEQVSGQELDDMYEQWILGAE